MRKVILSKKEFVKLVEDVHQTAVDHGWWDKLVGINVFECNVHAEWSEAWDEYAHGMPMEYVLNTETDTTFFETDPDKFNGHKPEGFAVELIDGVIRIMDWLGDQEDYSYIEEIKENNSTSYVTVPELIAFLHEKTSYWDKEDEYKCQSCVEFVLQWLDTHGIDPIAVLKRKNAYNKTRSYRHGGKIV